MTTTLRIGAVVALAAGLFAALPASAQPTNHADTVSKLNALRARAGASVAAIPTARPPAAIAGMAEMKARMKAATQARLDALRQARR